jgi:hypothetical protein
MCPDPCGVLFFFKLQKVHFILCHIETDWAQLSPLHAVEHLWHYLLEKDHTASKMFVNVLPFCATTVKKLMSKDIRTIVRFVSTVLKAIFILLVT